MHEYNSILHLHVGTNNIWILFKGHPVNEIFKNNILLNSYLDSNNI